MTRKFRLPTTIALFSVISVAFLRGLPAPPAQPAASGPTAQERPPLFPAQDLGLIEPPDRDEWQKPDFIMDKLRIADGSSIGEVGAGGGWFTIRLARRVGPNRDVYA